MLTLTPNKRLALFLQNQNETKKTSFSAFEPWLEYLWEECRKQNPTLPSLLTSYEENIIWEEIISSSTHGQILLGINSTVKLAFDAHQLIEHWDLKQVEDYSSTFDEQIFLAWRKEYQDRLQQINGCSHAKILDLLIEQLKMINLFETMIPKRITCIGFNEWTPQQNKFWQFLEENGVQRLDKNFVQKPKELYSRACASPNDELKTAVQQAKNWVLEKQKNEKQNSLSKIPIGIVVPDLEKDRDIIEELLTEVLPPKMFNIAAPKTLNTYPIIQSAFLTLKLAFYKISIQDLSRILRSPYLQLSLEESFILSSIDAVLLERRQTEYTLDEFIAFLNMHADLFSELNSNNHFLNRLNEIQNLKSLFKGKKKTSEWKEIIIQFLKTIGWTQNLILNKEELLLKAEWEKLLQKYVQLDRVLGAHSFQQAFYHIQQLAFKNSFLPSQEAWAPIQVLGLLESIGLPFEKMWVIGLQQEIWPKSPSPNPFISILLQHKNKCPRSSPKREYNMAKQYTESLCQSAETIIFSYPEMIDDRVLQISPLLSHLKPCHSRAGGNPQNMLKFTNDLDSRLRRNDEDGLLAPVPNPSNKGSVQAIKLQAHCPFRAFSEIRLNAKPLNKQSLGLTRAERGEIVHDVLALFWQETKTQAQLNSFASEKLDQKLQQIIQYSLERFEKKSGKLNNNYKELESNRLFDLIHRFLLLEKTRPSFEVIALEHKSEVKIGPLNLNIRIDRIDQLDNGQELLLDYKTGLVETSNWFKDPILDPQLPLYYVTREIPPVGFSFVVLKANEIKFLGVAKQELNIPGIKLLAKEYTWEEQSVIWHSSLQKMAEEYKQGIVDVKPAEEKICNNCSLPGFCRIV